MAPIKVGQMIPDGILAYLNAEDELQMVSVHSLAAGKKVIIYGVPGAFVPGCSMQRLIRDAKELNIIGIEEALLISANDPFVMKAWANSYPNNEHIKFQADANATFIRALGVEVDLSEQGLGIRSKRFALVVNDLVVTSAYIEEEIVKAN